MDDIYAARARALVGSRFRAQGRDASLGVDCVGLAIAVFGLSPTQYRRDYRLRGEHRRELEEALAPVFRRVARKRCRPGDIMVFQVSRDQLHLAVKSHAGFVHADARLGRVVETPGEHSWPLIAVYRRRVRASKGL